MEEPSVFCDENIGNGTIDQESADITPALSVGSDRLGRCSVLLPHKKELDKADMNSDVRVQTIEEEGSHYIDVSDDSCENKACDTAPHQECVFAVGDLVWIKTRTQQWWPGIVSDPKTAVKDSTNPEKTPTFLVKYLGSPNSTWCSSQDLKPFAEDFDQLTRQKESNSFKGALEKALGIIGCRVKSQMSCNCILENSEDVEKSSTAASLDDSVLSRFSPESFIASLKSLARDASACNKLELTVATNQLSSFYSSIGHLQLPLHLIKQCGDYVLKTPPQVGKSSKKSDLKVQLEDLEVSQFEPASFFAGVKHFARAASVSSELELSFTKEHLSDYYRSVGHLQLPLQVLKQNGDYVTKTPNRSKSRQKRSRGDENGLVSDKVGSPSRGSKKKKCVSFPHVDEKVESEVSPSLGLKGTDCSSDLSSIPSEPRPKGSNGERNSLKLVKGSDEAMNSPEVQNPPQLHLEKDEARIMEQSEVEKINFGTSEGSLNDVDMFGKVAEIVSRSPEDEFVCREGEEHVETVQQSVDLLSVLLNSSCVISTEQSLSHKPETSETLPNDVTEPPPGFDWIDPSSSLPDLNENCPSSFCNDHPLQGKKSNEVAFDPKKTDPPSSTTSSKKVQETLHSDREKVPKVSSVGLSSFQARDSPSTAKPHCKKMKLSEGFCDIPGFDNVPEKSQISSGKNSQKKRKERNKPDGVEPPSEAKRNRSLNAKEDPGAILALEFSPGYSLPSKDNLISVFSRFGVIDESAVQFLDDSNAQVLYVRTPDAKFAFRSLEKNNPYGDSLSHFKLYQKPSALGGNEEGGGKSQEKMEPLVPIDAHEGSAKVRKKNPGQNKPSLKDAVKTTNKAAKTPPDLAFMRKSVETMKSMLEKAGDRLPPEVRSKLENEIKAFLDKISVVNAGPSSSS